MKIFHNLYIAFLVLIFSSLFFCYCLFYYETSAPSKNNNSITVEIKPGSIDSIGNTLKKEKLIRSKFFFKLYIKLTNKTNLKSGVYSLSPNMDVKKIVNTLASGSKLGNVKITFKEGLNIRKTIEVIINNTNNKEEVIIDTLNDKEYLNELISKYWFLTDTILDENIYYPLEGYLYPSTYHFSSKDVSVKTIIETMLDEMENQLNSIKDTINTSGKSFHELLTLASIVELEGVTLEDRKQIAGVFYNRLESNMNLGSDVTTYYSAKVDIGERDLYATEVSACNNYNTRCATFKTLPISPICNPSIDSILSATTPDENNYYYFVADKNRKVYFSKNINEHNNTIAKLKKEGLWYEY